MIFFYLCTIIRQIITTVLVHIKCIFKETVLLISYINKYMYEGVCECAYLWISIVAK